MESTRVQENEVQSIIDSVTFFWQIQFLHPFCLSGGCTLRRMEKEIRFFRQTLEVFDFPMVFKDILDQDYPLRDVCRQIQRSMDHPSRLELIHILYGLSAADGDVHEKEVQVIQAIANYLNINKNDYESIKAMFAKDDKAPFRVLELSPDASDHEIKRAYRKMANKYHPDKVSHLGKEMQSSAEEKFKAVNSAYQQLKKNRNIS